MRRPKMYAYGFRRKVAIVACWWGWRGRWWRHRGIADTRGLYRTTGVLLGPMSLYVLW